MPELWVDEYRYRVVHVLSVGSHVHAFEIREFKTWDGARAQADRWIAEHKEVLIQTGKLHWMDADDLEEEVATLPKVMETYRHVGPRRKKVEEG